MPDHPSIQGLREALFKEACCSCPAPYDECPHDDPRPLLRDLEQAQAAYLTEHGVLLSGEGLVPDTRDVFTKHDAAAREYIAARGEYESAIQGGDPGSCHHAQERFDVATQRYASTLVEVASTGTTPRVESIGCSLADAEVILWLGDFAFRCRFSSRP